MLLALAGKHVADRFPIHGPAYGGAWKRKYERMAEQPATSRKVSYQRGSLLYAMWPADGDGLICGQEQKEEAFDTEFPNLRFDLLLNCADCYS